MLGTVARGTRNDASSPNLCDQIVFADDAVAVLDEVDQQIKKTCGSIGTIVPREHNSRRSVEREIFERKQHVAARNNLDKQLYRRVLIDEKSTAPPRQINRFARTAGIVLGTLETCRRPWIIRQSIRIGLAYGPVCSLSLRRSELGVRERLVRNRFGSIGFTERSYFRHTRFAQTVVVAINSHVATEWMHGPNKRD